MRVRLKDSIMSKDCSFSQQQSAEKNDSHIPSSLYDRYINQINQISTAPICLVRQGSLLWQPIDLQQHNPNTSSVSTMGHRTCTCLWEKKAKSKRCVLRLLKVATEVAEQTESGILFHREGMQEQNDLAPPLVLTLQTDRVIPLFDCKVKHGRDVPTTKWRWTAVLHEEFCRSAYKFWAQF